MPRLASAYQATGPRVGAQPGLASRGLTTVFDILDAGSNAVLSGFAGRPGNAIASLIPFVEADTIDVKDTILDTGNEIGNLMVKLIFDPLMYFGVGGLSAVGKARKAVKIATSAADAAVEGGRAFKAVARAVKPLVKAGRDTELIDQAAAQGVRFFNRARQEKAVIRNLNKVIKANPNETNRFLLTANIPFRKPFLELGSADRVLAPIAKALRPLRESRAVQGIIQTGKTMFQSTAEFESTRQVTDIYKSVVNIGREEAVRRAAQQVDAIAALKAAQNLADPNHIPKNVLFARGEGTISPVEVVRNRLLKPKNGLSGDYISVDFDELSDLVGKSLDEVTEVLQKHGLSITTFEIELYALNLSRQFPKGNFSSATYRRTAEQLKNTERVLEEVIEVAAKKVDPIVTGIPQKTFTIGKDVSLVQTDEFTTPFLASGRNLVPEDPDFVSLVQQHGSRFWEKEAGKEALHDMGIDFIVLGDTSHVVNPAALVKKTSDELFNMRFLEGGEAMFVHEAGRVRITVDNPSETFYNSGNSSQQQSLSKALELADDTSPDIIFAAKSKSFSEKFGDITEQLHIPGARILKVGTTEHEQILLGSESYKDLMKLLVNNKPLIGEYSVILKRAAEELELNSIDDILKQFNPETRTLDIRKVRRVIFDKIVSSPVEELRAIKTLTPRELESTFEIFEGFLTKKAIRTMGYDIVEMTENGTETIMILNPHRIIKGSAPVSRSISIAEAGPELAASSRFQRELKVIDRNYKNKLKALPEGADQIDINKEYTDAIFNAKRQSVINEINYADAIKAAGKLTPSEHTNWVMLHQRNEQMKALERAVGGLTEKLQSSQGLMSYVARIHTPEFLAWKKKGDFRYSLIQADITKNIAATYRRTSFISDSITTINAHLKSKWNLKFNIFEEDIVALMRGREIGHYNIMAKGALGHALVRMVGVPPIKKAVKATGSLLEGSQFKNAPKAIKGKAPKIDSNLIPASEVFRILKLNPDAAPKLLIDRAIMKDVLRQEQMIRKSEDLLNGFFGIMEKINGTFRVNLTALFPAKMHRDLFGNFWNSTAGGGMNFRNWWKAWGDYRKFAAADPAKTLDQIFDAATSKQMREMLELGVITDAGRDTTRAFLEVTGAKKSLQEFYNKPGTVIADKLRKVFGKEIPRRRAESMNLFFGRSYNRLIDNSSRMSFYLTHRAAGKSPAEAKRLLDTYLFDFNSLTRFERERLKPLVLFYSWTRKNLPRAMMNLIENPKMTTLYRDITGMDKEADLPDWMRSGFAFRVPGTEVYINKLGLPIGDVRIFNVTKADPQPGFAGFVNKVQNFGENVTSLLSPGPRLATEFITGRQSFSGKALNRMSLSDWARSVAPTARYDRTISQLFDGDIAIHEKIINNMVGARTYEFREHAAAADTGKRKLLSAEDEFGNPLFSRAGPFVFRRTPLEGKKDEFSGLERYVRQQTKLRQKRRRR